jgi:hypothetical protein
MSAQIDQDIEEWRIKIRNTGLCGIVQCYNKPATQCPTCNNHYCTEHYKTHFHLTPDSDPESHSLTDEQLV